MRTKAARRYGFGFEWKEFDWSCETYAKTGRMMPEDGIAQLTPFDAVFLGAVPNKIELFKNCSGLDFTEAYGRRVETRIDGELVKMICLPDLKTNKRASGRNKDLADLDNLP